MNTKRVSTEKKPRGIREESQNDKIADRKERNNVCNLKSFN